MAGDRTVQISYSYSEGAKPQQSYLRSAQQPGQLRALGRPEAQPGELGTALYSGNLNSPPRLDFPGNLDHSHLISLCSRFLHLLSAWAHPTSARGKAVVVRGFNEARKKIREKPLPPLPTSKISFSSHSKPQHRTEQKLPNPLCLEQGTPRPLPQSARAGIGGSPGTRAATTHCLVQKSSLAAVEQLQTHAGLNDAPGVQIRKTSSWLPIYAAPWVTALKHSNPQAEK